MNTHNPEARLAKNPLPLANPLRTQQYVDGAPPPYELTVVGEPSVLAGICLITLCQPCQPCSVYPPGI